MEQKRLMNQIALVTGAGGGIGRAICRRLASEGATVLVSDLVLEHAQEVARELKENVGAEAEAIATDVTDFSAIEACVNYAEERFGRIDILVNNAGGSADLKHRLTYFAEADDDIWEWVLRLNLHGPMKFVRQVLPGMIRRKYGRIVNIASIAGVVGIRQRADYAAAKAGMDAFSKTIAMECGLDGIRINCISPGLIERARPGMPENDEVTPSDGTWIGRYGKPGEIAGLVAFLVSSEGDYFTGQNLVMDGGRTLGPKR